MADNDRRSVLQRALEACLRGEADALPEFFTEDVTVWSPNLFATSLEELTAGIALREEALSNVNVQVDSLDVFGNKGFVEYRVTAVFSGPFALDADTVVEPNGNEILLGAALVAEFTADKISALRNYFDDASLLEQMLVA
jgi:ketosteroid isomerase-like protein